MDSLQRTQALNALLRVAACHVDLLKRDAFEALTRTLSRFVPLGRLVVVVPSHNEQTVYAVSVDTDALPTPYGARFPLPDAVNRGIVMGGAPRICEDTRAGDALDQFIARTGYLSYVAIPIQEPPRLHIASSRGVVGDPAISRGAVLAKLIVCFRDEGAAGSADLELLMEMAELFGVNFELCARLASDRRRAMIVDTAGDAMLAWDARGVITDANPAAATLTGLSRERLIGSSIDEALGTSAEPSPGTPLSLPDTMTLPVRDARGGIVGQRPVSISVTTVRDDPRVAAHALVRDESRLAAAEREALAHLARVRALEEQHRTLLDNAPLVIFRLEPQTGRLLYLNRHAERLLGVSPSQALKEPHSLRMLHVGDEAKAAFDAAVEVVRSGVVTASYEARLAAAGETEILVRGTVYPLREGDGLAAVEGTLIDVSAEHAVRASLVQGDRLRALGQLAASVAHEINNPAAFLMLGLQRLQGLLRTLGEPTREASTSPVFGAASLQEGAAGALDGEDLWQSGAQLVSELQAELSRIVTITQDLRLFAGPESESRAHYQLTDVNRAVQSAVTLTRCQTVSGAQVAVELGAAALVWMKGSRLPQVLVNLLINASQAVTEREASDHLIRVATRVIDDHAEIEVSDTGPGIALRDLERIWRPFFTTKSAERGTGLGLAICRQIVEEARGSITVESPAFRLGGEGFGARFLVRLPLADGPFEAAPTRPVTSSRALTRRRRLLLVDDEQRFAAALGRTLTDVYDVTVVCGGERAVELASGHVFDVILCDLLMPRVSGEVVFQRLCALVPAYRSAFVFMTGAGLGSPARSFLEDCERPCLQKPFTLSEALEALEGAGLGLDGDAAAGSLAAGAEVGQGRGSEEAS